MVESWKINGELDRSDGPAKIIRNLSTGETVLRGYYRAGKRHCEDGPAEEKSLEGEHWIEYWRNGKGYSSENKPFRTITDLESGIVTSLFFGNQNDKVHRTNGPAILYRSAKTGVVTHEEYRIEGNPHRLDGPAIVDRDETTGVAFLEEYYFHGKLHRDDGPGRIQRDPNTAEILRVEYYKHGAGVSGADNTPIPT